MRPRPTPPSCCSSWPAQKGDAATLPVLRGLMRSPSFVALCGGDLAHEAEQMLIRAAAGDDLAFREALTHRLAGMRAELAGPSPTPLERLLVERVVGCWLQVQDADGRSAQAERDGWMAVREYAQKRQDRAHKRFLSGIRMLALVRKLALPAIQLNIGKEQVNVVGR